ncbi:MAG: RdgB/HAM1 family non-canonical purine NTP pyrophosphatase [Alphaproteobacteria bacterium]|nr:RdgB/HAM1 family non-canonical purine NTP pyrophosphatase [Alphaproteobacteria bacterium]
MARRLAAGRLVIASHNAGKVREIADLLVPFGMDIVIAAALGLPEPEETEDSFAGNAALKALAAARGAGLTALADDSGLAVHAIGGRPGVHSARWGGPARDFQAAMARVMREIGEGGGRGADFVCALALAWPDGHVEGFEGRVAGTLVWPPRGGRGFGYDPIFVPEGDSRTFGEIDPDEKHRMSHRARAFDKLVAACFGQE